ncbi:MAG: RES family NAD+ phosphorylase, partial [Myxococcales bacterium]
MKLWRVARAAHAKSGSAAFTGIGGMSVDGRWHTRGRPIVYTARPESLAKLEALVHLNPTIAPRLVLVEATIADRLVATLHGAPP